MAERTSMSFRQKLKIGAAQALPARILAEHLGVILLTPRDIPGMIEDDIQVLSGDNGYSAMSLAVDDRKLIIRNPSHGEARTESDLMHELAHFIRKHNESGRADWGNLGLAMPVYDKEQEDEAKFLGGCLQVPREGLLKVVLNGMLPSEIATMFGASEALVGYRIKVTGVMMHVARYKKAGWRLN